jgi:glycosyltransferase involved in cell wall biosynthesis
MSKNCTPLVSIIVITYNSSKYVLETLESAKAQTYQNIELIVTDDCSTDSTIELCSKWIEENKDRFVRTRLILSSVNTGVAPNCNRGLNEAEGEWVKFIAGDDILTKECISSFVCFAQKTPEANFLFSAVVPFIDETIYKPIIAPKEFISASVIKQHKLLLKKGCCIPGPASFINIKILHILGGFDTRLPMHEDYPLWLKATGLNHKLYFSNFNCAMYRIHRNSLVGSAFLNNNLNPVFLRQYHATRSLLIMPLLLKNKLYFHYLHHKMRAWRSSKYVFGLNRIKRYLSYLFDPLGVYIKILRFMDLEYNYGPKLIKKSDVSGSSSN